MSLYLIWIWYLSRNSFLLWHKNDIIAPGHVVVPASSRMSLEAGTTTTTKKHRFNSTPVSLRCPSSCLAVHDPSCKTQGLASCPWGVQVGWTEQRKRRWQQYPRRPPCRSHIPPKTWNYPPWWCHTDTRPSQSPAWPTLEGTALHSYSLQSPGKTGYGLNARQYKIFIIHISMKLVAICKLYNCSVPTLWAWSQVL